MSGGSGRCRRPCGAGTPAGRCRSVARPPEVARTGRSWTRCRRCPPCRPTGTSPSRGMVRERDEVGEADLGVLVQAELGRLHGDLAAHARRLDPVEDLEVVGDDRLGLGEALEVLAEAGIHRRDASPLEGNGGRERVTEGLAGHESAHGSLHEPHPRQRSFSHRSARPTGRPGACSLLDEARSGPCVDGTRRSG